MQVHIQLDEPAWRLVGQKHLSVDLPGEQCSLADVIRELASRFSGIEAELRGQKGDFVPYSLFLNDESVRWEQVDRAPVRNGDHLRVILPIAGGRS